MTVGTYPSGLPSPGPDWTGVPAATDSNGNVTINALITAAGVGGTVTIPGDKIYTINASITPLSGQTIRAAPGSKVVLKAATGLGTVRMIDLSYVVGATIQNIRIDGNAANRTAQEGVTGAECIGATHGSNCTIVNCDINYSPSFLIWAWDHPDLSLRLNTGIENWQLTRLDACNGTLIEGNSFINTSAYKSLNGFFAMGTTGLTIRANTVYGFALQEPTSHGYEGTWGNAIFLQNIDDYLIENNDSSVESYWSSCVCGAGCTNGTLQHNNFNRGTVGWHSMWYEQPGADYLTVTHNLMNGGLLAGDGGGNHLTFTFNEVHTDEVGFDMSANLTVATVTDNTFTRRGATPEHNGVYMWEKTTPGNAIVFQRNVMTNYEYAVAINNSGGVGTVYGLTITTNTWIDCTYGAVLLGSVVADGSCTIQAESYVPAERTGVLAATDTSDVFWASVENEIQSQVDVGTYPSGLPEPGPDWEGIPGTIDATGDTTINALITSAGVGGTVTIPGNIVYTINASITPLDGQTIKAASGSPVVLKAADGLGTVRMIDLSYVVGATIQNIRIDGNAASRTAQESTTGAECIGMAHGSDCEIINCDISYAPAFAVWAWDHPGLSFRLNTGIENWQVTRLDECDGTLIEGNSFVNTAAYKSLNGFFAMGTTGLTIRANTVYGFGLQTPTYHDFEGTWGNAIYLTGVDDYLIENNDSSVSSYWSSCVCGAGCTNGTLRHNNFNRGTVGWQSMWFEQLGADYLICTYNLLNGGLLAGDGGGNHLTFTFNEVNTDEVGFDMSANLTVATVTDNTFTHRGSTPAHNGVYMWEKTTAGNAIVFQRNVVTNYEYAVAINNSGGVGTVNGLTVTGNTWVNCTYGATLLGTVVADGSCTIQTQSVPLPPPNPVASILGFVVVSEYDAPDTVVVTSALAAARTGTFIAVDTSDTMSAASQVERTGVLTATDTSDTFWAISAVVAELSFEEWLSASDRNPCVLVEVEVRSGSSEITRYLSNTGFTSGEFDVPALTHYLGVVNGGARISEELSLTGEAAMSFGDMEISNPAGDLDAWLNDVWAGRPCRVYVGDQRWKRSAFQLIFDGITADLTSRRRDVLNLTIRDKLQRLNTAVTETKLGGTSSNADRLKPLTFGEVHNILPLLVDKALLKYQVHDGSTERIIEVRDNGVPVAHTNTLAAGTFVLMASPAGTVTVSVQGYNGGGYKNTAAALVQLIATVYGKDKLVAADLDTSALATFDAANSQPLGMCLLDRDNVLSVCQQLASSVGAQLVMPASGKLRLVKIALPATGTPTQVDAVSMLDRSLEIAERPEVRVGAKLGYARNWCVQQNLQTGIPPEHKDLFAQEWLTTTATDTNVASIYKVSAEPEQVDTFLLVKADADAEAARRRDLWKVQRTVYRYEGLSPLLMEELGGYQTITDERFGLGAGVSGQIVAIERDWLAGRVVFEVLI